MNILVVADLVVLSILTLVGIVAFVIGFIEGFINSRNKEK